MDLVKVYGVVDVDVCCGCVGGGCGGSGVGWWGGLVWVWGVIRWIYDCVFLEMFIQSYSSLYISYGFL